MIFYEVYIMIPREKVCCFIGHRNLSARILPDLKSRLTAAVERLVEQGVCCFLSDGVRGFNALAAQTVLSLQKQYPHIELNLVLPFEGQEAFWKESDRLEFEEIRRHANNIVVLAPAYFCGCYYAHSRCLIASSGVCVCYQSRERSGTGRTVRLARQQGIVVLNLAGDEKSTSPTS